MSKRTPIPAEGTAAASSVELPVIVTDPAQALPDATQVTGVQEAEGIDGLVEAAAVGAPVGYIVRCHRERGVWRAGRFWPPENIPVGAHEISEGELLALQAEPLLSVIPVLE